MTTTLNPNLNVRAALLAGWIIKEPPDYEDGALMGHHPVHNSTFLGWDMVPDFTSDLTAIHAEVQRMTGSQMTAFNYKLNELARNGPKWICQLTAADWTECFVNVMEGEKK